MKGLNNNRWHFSPFLDLLPTSPGQQFELEGKRVCVLYDEENVGGGATRAEEILQLLRSSGAEIRLFIVASKDRNILKNITTIFEHVAPVEAPRVFSNKDSADAMLIMYSGFCLAKAISNQEYDGIVSVSDDKLISQSLRLWVDKGLRAYILCKTETSRFTAISPKIKTIRYDYKSKKKATHSPTFDRETYPYVYEGNAPARQSYLEVISLPNKRAPIPKYVILPLVGEEISVGANRKFRRGNAEIEKIQDCALDYWQHDRYPLYSPNVFFGLDEGGWYLRSAKGFRREMNAVMVNNKLIDSSDGKVRLKNGDNIFVKGFVFRFDEIDAITYNFPKSLENPHDKIDAIELFLHKLIFETLSSASSDWWTSLVPPTVRETCERMQTENKSSNHPSRFLYIRDMITIISENWTLFCPTPIGKAWTSNKLFKKGSGHLISVRNKVSHSMRGPLDARDSAFLSALTVMFEPFLIPN
jgi:hypothetical protein